MTKVAILIANGLEECEALVTKDLLNRANIQTDLISVEKDLNITSVHELSFKCDYLFNDVDLYAYDAIILPGGWDGTMTLMDFEPLGDILKYYFKHNKLIAAICAAPGILVKYNLVKDGLFTVYPECENDGKPNNEKVYQDGNVITAKALGSVFDFAYAIIKHLKDENSAKSVLDEVFY